MSDIRPNLPSSNKEFESGNSQAFRLEQQADTLLAQAETGEMNTDRSLRAAVAGDVRDGRDWVRQRAASSREGMQNNPIVTVAWALTVGIMVGLYLRR